MNPNKNNNSENGSSLSTGLGMAVAIALGAALGVLFAPKEGVETQKDILEKAQKMAKKFNKNREEIQRIVKNIFGELSEELEKNYLELQGNILAHLDHLQSKSELTQEMYNEVVDEQIKEFSKNKKWSENVLKNLKENFIEIWEDLRKII